MIHTRITFLYLHIDAVWMSGLVQPASVVASNAIHNEGVVPFPVPHRISIPLRILGISRPPAHTLGKRTPISPNCSPYSIELSQHDHPVRHLRKRNTSCLVKHVAWEPQ